MTDQVSRPPEVLREQGIADRDDVAPVQGGRAAPDYRDQLRSRRWNAAPLRNPEVEKTDPRIAVAFIIALSVVTLLILVVGYASGFWSLPADEALSGAVTALELLA
jgi:hypothetical protein